MKVLSNVIVQYQGNEYRLTQEKTVPALPDELIQILVRDGYLEQVKQKEGR